MATEYISREAAIEALCKAHSPYPRRTEISVRAIQDISPADVKPVVRGKWKHDGSDWKNRFICDQCGYKWFFEAEEAHFCPNCGADMRKVVEIDQVKEEPCEACSLDWLYKDK